MRTRILTLAVWGLVALLALAVVGGCTESESDDSSAETEESSTEAEGTADGAATEEGATDSSAEDSEEDEMAAFVGTWENADGDVFTRVTFNADGTATLTNYAGMKTEGTWSVEEAYMEVASTEDESYAAMTVWVSETEWDWAYEDGTWTAVE